jgi:peptidoglycan glycosyltransferase
MNRQIRRVAAAVGVLMLALFLNLNFVQVVKGGSYRNNPNNQRVILDEYSTPRGQIVVDGKAIAQSVATDDELKYLRVYPDGPVYAPITGYYSLVYGKDGIEEAEDAVLSGTDNRLIGSRISGILTGRDPKGGSVVLTLNDAAEQAAYKALAGRPGAVVALDPATGAILAAVTSPSYDPNTISSHDTATDQANWDALQPKVAPLTPMLNRAFQQTYPPGSVFKVIVSAAALKAGIKPTDEIAAPRLLTLPDTGGTTLQNFDGESCGANGLDTFANALAISCNTAFAGLGLKLGAPAIEQEATEFGLTGQPLSVPLTVDGSTVGPINSFGDLAHASIGQQSVRVTPLQVAMIAAAVANGGSLMQPYLVDQQRAPDLSILSQTQPKQLSQVLPQSLDEQLVQMMVGVVQYGTGTKAQITDIPGVTVGGKTGTADTGIFVNGQQTPPHAWFAGFANQNGVPKIAVAVVLENGGVNGNETTGGLAAAPVAKAVMEAYLQSPAGH